jgi:UDP-GlcNAc3NAcA epimerase
MRIASIVGARPQLIKAAPVSAALRAAGPREVLVHTGQHYDREMSQQSSEELEIPQPAYNLGVGSGPHGRQTGQILMALEEVLQAQRPDCVQVFGGASSTLAGWVTPGISVATDRSEA